MIAAVREWLTGVVLVTLMISVLQTLLPEGGIKKIAGFISGLILMITLLQPLLQIEAEDLTLELSDYMRAVEDLETELTAQKQLRLAQVIAEQTAAYISDRADLLGLEISVRVETTADRMPVPALVEVVGPRSEELAQWMEKELGIPEERQVWHESEN